MILLQEAAAAPNPPAKTDPPSTGGKHDFSTSSHYKLNIRRGGAKMPFKPQSLSSPSRHADKSLMFEGLDDLESGTAGTFKPRKNFKKLVIPPHSPRPVSNVRVACLCVYYMYAYIRVCPVFVCVFGFLSFITLHHRHEVFQTLLLLLPLWRPHAAKSRPQHLLTLKQ